MEEFENLDPLARDERVYGAGEEEEEREVRRPLRVVGGTADDVEMTPPASPEMVVSDTEMTDE